MGQCHIHDGCRYEVSGPDGPMGNDGKCSVPIWRTCFSLGGVVTTTMHYKKKYFLLLEGLGAVGGIEVGGGILLKPTCGMDYPPLSILLKPTNMGDRNWKETEGSVCDNPPPHPPTQTPTPPPSLVTGLTTGRILNSQPS